jgi:hypothetical protein
MDSTATQFDRIRSPKIQRMMLAADDLIAL